MLWQNYDCAYPGAQPAVINISSVQPCTIHYHCITENRTSAPQTLEVQ